MHVFWNAAENRLRVLWRVLLQAVLMIALAVIPILLVAEPLTALHKRGRFLAGLNAGSYDRVINMIAGPLLMLAVLASVLIAVRFLDHRSISELWVVFDQRWRSGFLIGIAIGAILMSIVFVAEYAAGWVTVAGTMATNAAGVSLLLAISFSFVKVVCVGIYEEAVCRGYLLRNLADALNLRVSIVVTSAVFAILHLTNDNSSFLSTVGLFINGILFAVAVLSTGRLSTAIGLHMAWNFFEGVVYGFPVSGDKEGATLVAIRQAGPVFLTGGNFGPEAGVIGIVASVIGIVMLWSLRSDKRLDAKHRLAT